VTARESPVGAFATSIDVAAPTGLQASRFRLADDEYVVFRLRQAPVGALSSAERAVASLAAAGRSNQAIAATRATSARTVANQLARIYRKLGIGSRAELAAVLA